MTRRPRLGLVEALRAVVERLVGGDWVGLAPNKKYMYVYIYIYIHIRTYYQARRPLIQFNV